MWFLVVAIAALASAQAPAPAPAPAPAYPTQSYLSAANYPVINADLWDKEPKIFTANYAFEGIQGIPGGDDEAIAREAGAAWNTIPAYCPQNNSQLITSSNTPDDIATAWGWPTYYADAMPVVFSWPVLASTAQGSDFQLTLNNGSKVLAWVAGPFPNVEPNERHTIVIYGDFGNRISPGTPGALYVEKVEIVDDGTPLMLVGPEGKLVSGVGLTYEVGKNYPYGPEAVGPKMVAAKLSVMNTTGEGNEIFPGPSVYPNDCISLYNETQYRLRIYTSGGFSPDGVSALFPTDYTTYFRIHLTLPNGETVILEEDKVDYEIPGAGSIKVLGMADLGMKSESGVYDACSGDDHDNYIDFCLIGDERAMRLVTGIEMPVGNSTADPEGRYKGLYNPGGPGNNPTPGVNYTVASAYQLQDVWITIDDPWTTSYPYPAVDPTAAMAPAPGPANTPPTTPTPNPTPTPVPTPSPMPTLSPASPSSGAAGLRAAAGAAVAMAAAWLF